MSNAAVGAIGAGSKSRLGRASMPPFALHYPAGLTYLVWSPAAGCYVAIVPEMVANR